MKDALLKRKSRIATIAVLFLCMLLFKFTSDLGYWWLTGQDPQTYRADFNPLKYALGLVCCIVLFSAIRHTQRKASSFLLYVVFLLQIVPMTTVYSMGNDSTEYYCVVCLSFLLCELIVGYVDIPPLVQRNPVLSRGINLCFAAATAAVLAIIILQNGMPSLTALNIYDVYELRASGAFQLGKYMNYLFAWVTKALLPFGIAWALAKRKYVLGAAACGMLFLLYLYSGNKTMLFAIPLVIVGTLWAKRENFYREIFIVACVCFTVLVLLVLFSPVLNTLWERTYSLFGRRTMIVPANNKFKYFDYFNSHPKMGIYGIFPRWILPMDSYYENVAYSYEISAIYYGKPEMNSNTGFLAEGFLRFGHAGTVMILLLFALLLRQVDRYQDRVGYPMAVGLFVYPVFSLSDGFLLDSLAMGPWTILVLILFFGTFANQRDQGHFTDRGECSDPTTYQLNTQEECYHNE